MIENDTQIIFCAGYCEHGKFMGECTDCADKEIKEREEEE